MAGRSAAEAATGFFDALQQCVSCITLAVLQGRAYASGAGPHAVSFGPQPHVRLGRHSGLWLRIKQPYEIVRLNEQQTSWAVVTTGYEYRILNDQGQSILTYHWHPIGRSPVTDPHLHVGGRTTPLDLSKVHLPTGPVTLIDIIRLTITELGVQPLRPDWQTVLDRAERDMPLLVL